MEEDIYESLKSAPVEKVLESRLKRAIDIADERGKYESAHNPPLLRALGIVKAFLKRRGRVCYGGTAMNMILPPKKRFYNPELDLPDYDFFTPAIDEDIKALVSDLQKAGLEDVMHRVGIHEGTKKILVNFIPIADMTELTPAIYSIFHKRAIIKGGVHYTDPDILRMMMYLELSRPKGMVSRWQKVFERLQLINTTFPPKAKRLGTRKKRVVEKDSGSLTDTIITFCIDYQRILIAGGVDTFYSDLFTKKVKEYNTRDIHGVIAFCSPLAENDALELKRSANDITLTLHKSKGETVPDYVEVKHFGKTVLMIFQEVACHSYLTFPTMDGRIIAIASPDTLITMYYSILIFTNTARKHFPGLGHQITNLVKWVEENRTTRSPVIPAFSLNCRGYQKGYSSLLREKYERILKEKGDVK